MQFSFSECNFFYPPHFIFYSVQSSFQSNTRVKMYFSKSKITYFNISNYLQKLLSYSNTSKRIRYFPTRWRLIIPRIQSSSCPVGSTLSPDEYHSKVFPYYTVRWGHLVFYVFKEVRNRKRMLGDPVHYMYVSVEQQQARLSSGLEGVLKHDITKMLVYIKQL